VLSALSGLHHFCFDGLVTTPAQQAVMVPDLSDEALG
jgi:hypothetical protein